MHLLLTERPNLFEPNDQMAFYLELRNVEVDKLKEAIFQAYQNHETTMCKIVLQEDGVAYYEKMEATKNTVEISNCSWHELLLREEKRPFELEKGELVRCFIIPHQEHIGLFIYAHHLVGDGKAIMIFINDIMDAYNQKPLTYQPLSLLTKEDISKVDKLSTKAKIYTQFCNWRYRLLGNRVYTWKDYYSLQKIYWRQHSSKITYYTFSQEETQQLLKTSKQMGVSLNSFLVTHLLPRDEKKHSVGMITSLREKQNRTLANLISGISSTLIYQKNESIEANVKKVHQEIQRSLNKYRYFVIHFMASFTPSLVDGILMHTHGTYQNILLEEVSRLTGYKGNFTRDMGLTNLTVLDVKAQYEAIGIDQVLVIAPLISYTRSVVCASTFNGQLTLTYHDIIKDGKENKEFFENFIQNLTNE